MGWDEVVPLVGIRQVWVRCELQVESTAMAVGTRHRCAAGVMEKRAHGQYVADFCVDGDWVRWVYWL